MSGKKVEGNEQQKRAKAREAAAEGKSLSEVGGTTGASKQREHVRTSEDRRAALDAREDSKNP